MSLETDELYMRRCFALASQGIGNVAPNPMVGAVIVHQNKIIGEGWHQQYGAEHAEVNAINSVKDLSLLKESTLYVNLEPCSHFGKTPPCCNLVVESEISRVVISSLDPNPKVVAGGSIKRMQNAGIEVVTGVLEKEGQELNRRFFTFYIKQRPYIILKWAQTLDGFMDIDRSQNAKQNYWITNDWLKTLNHKWRTEEQGIMIGTNTAENDNPRLNIRYWVGENPLRILIDQHNRLDPNLHCFDKTQPTVVYTALSIHSETNLEYVQLDFSKDIIPQIMKDLYDRHILSVIIEGGQSLLNTFIEKNLWDEARLLIGNKTFSQGLQSPHLSLRPNIIEDVLDNKILYYRNRIPN